MRRSSWVFFLSGALVLYLSGCKCGQDKDKTTKPVDNVGEQPYESTVSKLPGAKVDKVAELVPQSSDFVILSGNLKNLLDWLDSRDWFKELKETPPFQDLRATGSMLRLSTLRHRLESVSAVRIGRANLAELLSTPLALAGRYQEGNSQILVIKQIDLKVQALDRLVEVLNQISPRKGIISSKEVEGSKLRDLRLSESTHLYYLLFSNLLLASNSEEYLLEAVKLAKGKSKDSLLADSELSKLLLKDQQQYDLVGLIDFEAMFNTEDHWLQHFMPLGRMVLRFKGGAGAKLELALPHQEEEEEGAAKSANVPYLAGKVIPLDSRLVFAVADADLSGLWESLSDRIENPGKLAKRMKFNLPNDLLAHLEKKVIFIVGGADTSSKRPMPHLAAIMKTGKAPAVEAAMQKLFAFTFGTTPKKKTLKDMADRVMYHFPGRRTFTPAFALVDNWLVVGTTEEMVRKVIATSVGHEPSIHDLPGFADKVAAAKKPYYVLSYLDCGLLFDDLKNYSDTIIKVGDRFEADDVEDTLTPFWQALKKVGKLGGTLTLDKAGVSGTVVAL